METFQMKAQGRSNNQEKPWIQMNKKETPSNSNSFPVSGGHNLYNYISKHPGHEATFNNTHFFYKKLAIRDRGLRWQKK